MHLAAIPARHPMCRAVLIVALISGGTGAVAAMDPTGPAPTATVTRILPSDRPIALIESLDPANAGVTFVLMPDAVETATPKRVVERINICIPCEDLA